MISANTALQSAAYVGVQFDHLKELLSRKDLQRVRIAAAFARWDGLGLIASYLEKLIARGGRVELIFGVGNGVTTPDSLLYGLLLKKLGNNRVYIGAVIDEYSNSLFHPKMYEFKFESSISALIGSANMTGAGLTRNTEVSAVVTVDGANPVAAEWESVWKHIKAAATDVTLPFVRSLVRGGYAGSEKKPSGDEREWSGKPRLKQPVRAKAKPLFKKILDFDGDLDKADALKDLDTATDPPKHLYLQINEYETGGTKNRPGYQVQLPVATLGAFFQVGEKQSKPVVFHFTNETLEVTLSHFENKTHRVRLRPILDIERPAVLKFTRISDGEYNVTPVPRNRYGLVLRTKCLNQTSVKARRWGME